MNILPVQKEYTKLKFRLRWENTSWPWKMSREILWNEGLRF